MKIAITGGAGFIGSHLTKAYLDAGHDVFVIDALIHSTPDAVDERARFYHVDIRDSKLQTILEMERPDVVSHHVSQQECFSFPRKDQTLYDADLHVRGLLHLLDACVNASVSKFMFASGGNTLYGPGYLCPTDTLPGPLPLLKEDTPLAPQHPYDISKCAGEWYVRYYTRQYGLEHTILRYADVYGETDVERLHHPLSYFVRMLLEGHRPIIRGAADELRDHIIVDDVVRANLLALTRGRNQTLHISSGEGYSLRQMFQAVVQALQLDVEPVYISQSLGNPAATALDNSRARQLLGWRPEIDFATGVQIAVDRLQGYAVPDQSLFAQSSQIFHIEPFLVGTR